jgi:hypothetical protein
MTAYPGVIRLSRGQRLILEKSRAVVFHRRSVRRSKVERAARRVGLRWDGEVYKRQERLFGLGTRLNERPGCGSGLATGPRSEITIDSASTPRPGLKST